MIKPTKSSDVVLRPVRANAGVQAAYYERLERLIDAMNRSIAWHLAVAYRANTPAMAMDATPSEEIRKIVGKLARRWVREFDEAAERIATLFVGGVTKNAEASFKTILSKAGFSVPFKPSPQMNDAFADVLAENVALIKSIPAKQFAAIEQAVARSVQGGRDLKTLSDELLELGAKSRNRAAFIARDQNNKATAVMTKARRLSLGITEAIWVHSGGGVHPRKSHQKAGKDKLRYDISKGALIDDVLIMPGELPNCRCTSRAVIPGFGD